MSEPSAKVCGYLCSLLSRETWTCGRPIVPGCGACNLHVCSFTKTLDGKVFQCKNAALDGCMACIDHKCNVGGCILAMVEDPDGTRTLECTYHRKVFPWEILETCLENQTKK